MRGPERERGAALLTVLLLVAVIAVLAATALEKLRLSTRLATNAAGLADARGLGIAAETMATTRLGALLARQPDRMTLAQGWSNRPFPLPLPGGLATARLTDGGNCFNLNGLVTDLGGGRYAANGSQIVIFARLLRLVGVDGQAADRIAASAADWIDSDDTPTAGGAEDQDYAAAGYRTAGTLMADPSELRAVAGVTPAAYGALRPWVCTLPVARPSTINVDTLLPEQAPLLAMLAPDTVSVAQAQNALLQRPPDGFANADDVWRQGALAAAASGSGGGQGQTDVKTHWFALAIDVRAGDVTLDEHALIDATQLPPRLVSRQWGEQP